MMTDDAKLDADIAAFAKVAKIAGLDELPTEALRLMAFAAFHCYVRRLSGEEATSGDDLEAHTQRK